MTNTANKRPHLLLAGLVALPLFAGCGLRGSPVRPAPIFKKAAPVQAATPAPKAVSAPPRSVVIRERVDAFGVEIPDAAPVRPVQSAPLTDPVEPDDE
jgi:hypothetical protein